MGTAHSFVGSCFDRWVARCINLHSKNIPKAVLAIVLVVVLVAVLIVDGIGSKLALLWVLWVMLLISTRVLVLITRIVIRRIGHLLIIFYGISSARLK
jgi:hypothetical protein